MIINEQGLLEGRRLRRCSSRARILWVFYYAVSNDYARLEFDFDLVADQLRNLKELSPTPEEVEQHFNEYVAQHLLFRYESKGKKMWGVWDTRSTELKKHKTAKSKRSPNPPDAEYIAWLKEHHGEEEWEAFHTGYSDSSAKPFTKHLPKPRETVSADLPNSDAKAMALAVGVGPGIGNGVGVGLGLGNQSRIADAGADKTVSDETDTTQAEQDTRAVPLTAKSREPNSKAGYAASLPVQSPCQGKRPACWRAHRLPHPA